MPPADLLFDAGFVEQAIADLAVRINAECGDDDWLVLCVMNGGLMFTAELMQHFSFPHRLDAIRVSRYRGTTTGSELHWHAHPVADIEGQRVLLLDDIFDEGHTLAAIDDYLLAKGALMVRSAVLVDKLHERKVQNFRPDYTGFICPDRYVFGFGMDYESRYRHLREIFALQGS
jgi:hypoxanthine phosphoribosyltransferase